MSTPLVGNFMTECVIFMLFLFQDYEETIPSAKINDTSFESQAYFYWKETIIFFFENPPKNKSIIFQLHKHPIY